MSRKNEESISNEETNTKIESPPITVAKKLTLRGLVGAPKEMREYATEKGTKIARVVGICVSTKSVKTTMPDGKVSESIGMLGEFTGLNLQTGEEVYASVCYLPEPVPGMVLAALSAKDKVRLELAVEVSVKTSNTTIGYEFLISPLKQFEPSEEIKKLTASLT